MITSSLSLLLHSFPLFACGVIPQDVGLNDLLQHRSSPWVETFSNRLLEHGFPIETQVQTENLLQCGLLSFLPGTHSFVSYPWAAAFFRSFPPTLVKLIFHKLQCGYPLHLNSLQAAEGQSASLRSSPQAAAAGESPLCCLGNLLPLPQWLFPSHFL